MTSGPASVAEPVMWLDEGSIIRAELHGPWVVSQAQKLDHTLVRPKGHDGGQPVVIDLGHIEHIDTVGAWLIHRTAARWREQGCTVTIANSTPTLDVLLTQVAKAAIDPPKPPPVLPTPIRQLTCLGRDTVAVLNEAARLFEFIGQTVATLLRILLLHPGRLRLTAIFAQMWSVGISAMPIVGMISFLIGVVIAFQGVDLLRTFGAEIYVVNLVGISVLRELGILLTSIVVAGRSGSSFTAQIGSMKLREEVDAMRTLGLDPMEVLVVPRVLALALMLPCLTFFSDMMGLAGGAVMSWATLGIAPQLFFDHLLGAITWKSFAVGMIKAPFFAVTIAIVGCLEGLAVEGSAEAVGNRTTASVVKSIFLVIVLDAAFSIFFSAIDF